LVVSLRSHDFAAAGTGAHQDQASDERRFGQRQFLRDQSTQRETEYVNSRQTQRFDEGRGIPRHAFDGGRHLTGGTGDAGVIEQDDFAILRNSVRHPRVPVVHRAGETHVEDERCAPRLSKTTIGKADAVGFDVLRRRCLMGMCGHADHPLSLSAQPAVLPPSTVTI
jgi:hypothetical protein